ncbi:MAG: hypothetical protein A2138_27290 [Deltaproteobacteria bacterium RBG_16_71_12]|nr:MAG: hypothetical protein A2138_27290 [Deltaproteobacteria bacterium RBG_16_71_12]
MITLVAALVLSQTPGTDEPAARALSPDFADCLALLEAGDQEGARACYAAHASPAAGEDERQAALARELADVVSTLRLPPPPEQLTAPRPANPLDVGALVTSGKAELIVWSALSGSFAAELTVWTAIVAVGAVMGTPAIAVGGLLLAPVVGGLAGLGLATTLVLALPGLTAGDANIVRAFLLLGLFDAVTFGVSAAALGVSPGFGNGAPVVAGMVLAQVAATAIGVGAAAAFDLPEGAGAAAISGALWASVLSVLVVDMFDGFKNGATLVPPMIGLAGNAGFAAGAALASTVLPLSRTDTWAVDVGGAIGLAGGAALAFGLRAPNPVLGYGAMALGCAGGMVAGGAAARLVPPLLQSLPDLVAVTPLAMPAPDAGPSPVGVAIAGVF